MGLGRKPSLTGIDYMIGAADHLSNGGRNVGPALFSELVQTYALGGNGVAPNSDAQNYALSEFDHVDKAALAVVNEAIELALRRKDHAAVVEIARAAAMVSLRWRGFAQLRAEEGSS